MKLTLEQKMLIANALRSVNYKGTDIIFASKLLQKIEKSIEKEIKNNGNLEENIIK